MNHDEQLQAQLDAAAEVTNALRKLYEACDGDEAQVGEILYECDKAARIDANDNS